MCRIVNTILLWLLTARSGVSCFKSFLRKTTAVAPAAGFCGANVVITQREGGDFSGFREGFSGVACGRESYVSVSGRDNEIQWVSRLNVYQ